jgi:hypothetical protein
MTRALLVSIVALMSGCSFLARDTATYERDTSALLDTRQAELERCYTSALTRNPELVGKLTVTFTVAKQTGKLTQLSWDRNRTTVDDTLATCVVGALAGLTLAEPDRRDGQATFSFAFRSVGGDVSVEPGG